MLPFFLFTYSASSGNSAELTTVKDLKRSKNKGRKKKAKTRQSQSRTTIKLTEPILEDGILTINDKPTASSTLEQNPILTTDVADRAEDVTKISDDINLANKQNTGE